MITSTEATFSGREEPSAASDPTLVGHLRDSEIYRDYQKAFEAATGLPLILRAVGSFQPPLRGSKAINPFCTLMAAGNRTCAACLELQQRVESEAGDGPRTLECFAGLSDSAVPIRVGERIIAYLQTGQVFLRRPTEARFAKVLELVRKWGGKAEAKELKSAYFAGRTIGRVQYESVLRLLAIFAEQLSGLTNRIMVQSSTAEAPAVVKARNFIAAHQGEEISLGDVARAVNMSVFYFCKVFKRETGLTFTDYIARVRIESVKSLLLNPHKRVSEAAYEAGFQSLSQFNRVFRRIAGEAPSVYRDHLHGSGEPAPAARAA